MATVSQLLAIKGRTVHSIDKSATVFEAISRMVERNVGALLALEGMRPVGILTERDYLRKVALHGRASRTTRVEEIMSTELISIAMETGVEECMSLMTRNHIRHLPVFEGSEIAGIVSIGDIVKHRLGQLESENQALYEYITQGR